MCLNVTTTNKRSANMNITTIYHTTERKKNYWLLESAVYLMFWVIFAQLLCQVRYGRSYAKMFDTQCSNINEWYRWSKSYYDHTWDSVWFTILPDMITQHHACYLVNDILSKWPQECAWPGIRKGRYSPFPR